MPGRSQLALALVACVSVALAAPSARAEFDDPAAESPEVTAYHPVFSDVPPGHIFETEIRSLFVSGITKGCDTDSTEFCPDDTVTRGQMAAFLTRALDLPERPSTDFIDDDQSVFENDIQKLAAAQITRGCNPPDNNRYCPDQPVTRGQMAAFLTRALALPTPPALPTGVTLQRAPTEGSGLGTKLTICRDASQSLLVRSATSGAPEVGNARLWEPTHFDLTAGEVDFTSDQWFLPAGQGCQTLDVAWDPKANTLSPPLDTLEVVSHFGPRLHPILGGVRLHAGTDFRAETGDPVYASSPGVVVHAGARAGYGSLVDIEHVGGLNTRYAHLSAIEVSVGDLVVTGDVVGSIGCTGLCTAPHLHFETREFDVAVDPMTYLEETSKAEPG